MANPPSRAQVTNNDKTNTTKNAFAATNTTQALNQTKPATMAQIDKKELPQSGMPVSDLFIDGLKKIAMPSRA